MLRILHLEDNALDAELVSAELSSGGLTCEIVHARSREEFAQALARGELDLILADFTLPTLDGFEALEMARSVAPGVPFLVVTGTIGEEKAVAMLKGGATDFLLKDRLSRLVPAVRRALREAEEREELRRTSAALRDSEARYRDLYEEAPHAYFSLDAEGRIAMANRSAVDLSGRSLEALVGGSILDVVASADADVGRALELTARLRAGEPIQEELEIRRADRRAVWAIVTVRPIRDSQGKLVASHVSALDNTARREALEKVREAEAALDLILQSVPVVLYRARAYGDYGVTWISKNVSRTFGFPVETFLETPTFWKSRIHPDDREPWFQSIRRVLDEGAATLELRFQKANGAYGWRALDLALVRDEEGNPQEIVGTNLDISERRTLQQQLLQAQKMEAIGNLAGGIAHDFNNLLTVILSTGHFLLEELAEGSTEREDVLQIQQAASRAVALTRQLLAFSRRQMVQPKVLELNSVVANLEKMLRRLIGEDIELLTRLSPDLWRVKIDPTHLEQVVMNLMVNSRDAMPQGGRIVLETTNAKVDETAARKRVGLKAGDYVLLSVTDTGTGMDAATLARIFEPFFTTKEGKGTGLGLATVYGIVEQSGGHIEVESEPGKGSTFRIYVPRTLHEEEASHVESAFAAGSIPATILLVEDDAQIRAVARRVLERHRYTVLEAPDAVRAQEVLEAHPGPLHLLMTDVVMPGVGGTRVAEMLLREHPGARVLYMSGYTDDTVLRHGVRIGEAAFLQKPFTADELVRKVREVLAAGGEGA